MCPVRADGKTIRAGCPASTNRRLEEICPAASADFSISTLPGRRVGRITTRASAGTKTRTLFGARTMAQYSAHERGLFVPTGSDRFRPVNSPGTKFFQRWFSP